MTDPAREEALLKEAREIALVEMLAKREARILGRAALFTNEAIADRCRCGEYDDEGPVRSALAALRSREAEIERKDAAIGTFADALDVADRLIERGYGVQTPQEWHDAYRRCATSRAAPEPK